MGVLTRELQTIFLLNSKNNKQLHHKKAFIKFYNLKSGSVN